MTVFFLSTLEGCFLKTAEISLHASLIIAVLLALRPLLKRFLPPRWVGALWLIVVARLLLVAVPSLPEPASPPLQKAWSAVQSMNGENAVLPAAVAPALEAVPVPAVTWMQVLAAIWALGAAGLLAHFAAWHLLWMRRLRRAPEIREPAIVRLVEECQREMGVGKIRLVRLAGFASPSMTGLFRPTIVLPEDFLERFTPGELRWILLHEMVHLKRRDLPVQFLCRILQAMHWFNPLVWFAFACFRADAELACDAFVLDRETVESPHAYGHALIKVAETYPRSLLSPGFLGVTEERTDLQERVEKISRHRRPSLVWITAGAALCALLAVVFLTRFEQPLHAATAKIRIDGGGQRDIEVMKSINVVVPAVTSLGLDKKWARATGSGENALTPVEIMDRASPALTITQLDIPGFIFYVTVKLGNRREAADLANAIASQYRDQLRTSDRQGLIQNQNNGPYSNNIFNDQDQVSDTKASLYKLQQELAATDAAPAQVQAGETPEAAANRKKAFHAQFEQSIRQRQSQLDDEESQLARDVRQRDRSTQQLLDSQTDRVTILAPAY